jgi:hypothetical protein
MEVALATPSATPEYPLRRMALALLKLSAVSMTLPFMLLASERLMALR